MTHLFRWPNQFSDVFVSAIDGEFITYEVRDKLTGVLMEPKRTTKFVVDEIKNSIYLDERTMPMDIFNAAYLMLN